MRLPAAFTLVWLASCAQAPEEVPPLERLTTEVPLIARDDILAPGETCVYRVSWGILPVGEVTYTLRNVSTTAGELMELTAVTRPSAFLKVFLRVSGTSRSLIDPATFLPLASLWTTTDGEVAQVRSIDFRQEEAEAFSVKYAPDWQVMRHVRGSGLRDPLSAVYLARLLVVPEEGEEIRFVIVEGRNTHLMTVRGAGRTTGRYLGRDVPCSKLAIRTDRIDEDGRFMDEQPWNNFFAWVAETPHRPLLKMSGKTLYARVTLTLSHRGLHASAPGDERCRADAWSRAGRP